MKPNKLCAVAAVAISACGGQISTDQFRANAPTFDKFAISQNDSDEAAPVSAGAPDALQQDAMTATCHPHLFMRTGDVIGRLNRHFYKLLRHVHEVIRDAPRLAAGETRIWENVRNGIDRKLTMTATANLDGSTTYDFKLEVKSTGDFVQVMSGSMTHIGPAAADVADAGPATRVENKGSATFDFTALASVIPTERARGQITDAFDTVHDPVLGVKRSATLTLTDFVPDEGDPRGPRNGSYSWVREPGVGGKFVFQDSLVLYCPSNPSLLAADVTTVARWYKAQDGAVHGRSDARASGGPIAQGQTWIGVTCANGQTRAMPAEGYWMMKLEDASGATLAGSADTMGSTPCDPAFGPVPSLNDNANDYDFSAPASFPNEWN